MAARRHCARALTRAASAPGYNAQYQAEIAIKLVAPAIVIIVANRSPNRSHTTIVTHNRMVGQRAGVCGRTKTRTRMSMRKEAEQRQSNPLALLRSGKMLQQRAVMRR